MAWYLAIFQPKHLLFQRLEDRGEDVQEHCKLLREAGAWYDGPAGTGGGQGEIANTSKTAVYVHHLRYSHR